MTAQRGFCQSMIKIMYEFLYPPEGQTEGGLTPADSMNSLRASGSIGVF